ncbi:hypothetical protein AST99_13435 [Formosa algae]|nr:hypothetical protein AST99_13435 [Formosa algae]
MTCAFTQYSHAQELKLKYFGGAGWEMSDGNVTILVDPYISRLKLGDSPSNSKDDTRKPYYPEDVYQSDTVTINKVLNKKVDYILVHHSHLDHLADVPYIAKKTGAMVIATETSCKILKAYGIPESQLLRVRGGEDYQFDAFSVRVIPSIHSALNDKHYYDSRTHDEDIDLPLKLEDFIEGKSLMFLVRFKDHKVLTAGSMNFLEREVDGLKPDVILPGVNFSRLEIYKYTERLMKLTNYPKIVIPTHWDNFRVPYGFSQDDAIEKKIKPFLEEMKQASPNSKVIVPVHLETITIK